jgi:DNA-binding NarL/FixJ family response regulator
VTLKVILADDSFLMREAIFSLLKERFDVVSVCENYDELLQAVETDRVDVVVTDIRMPPTKTDEGIRAALAIRAEYPHIGVVVLSQYIEPEYAVQLFDSGASGLGYLVKDRVGDADQLSNAVIAVSEGRSVVDPFVVDALILGRARGKERKLDRLTPRELEVLEKVAAGQTNAGIAESLHLSERAVEKHINSVFTKFDLGFEPDINKRVSAVILYLSEVD